ncbi:MAG: hypothetical protein QXS91_00485 [Candidatus Anstonellales archaeon]
MNIKDRNYLEFSVFVILIFLLISILSGLSIAYYMIENKAIDPLSMPFLLKIFLDFHIELMFLSGLIGIFSGLIIYRVYNKYNGEKQQKKALQKMHFSTLLKLFPKEDIEIIEYAVKKNGTLTQFDISKLLNSRLKAHRAVKRLEKNGIIIVNKDRKTNIINLKPEIKILFENFLN